MHYTPVAIALCTDLIRRFNSEEFHYVISKIKFQRDLPLSTNAKRVKKETEKMLCSSGLRDT